MKNIVGLLMALALLLTATRPITAIPLLMPALCLWGALALSWSGLNKATQRQAGVLLGIGISGLLWGGLQQQALPIERALSANTPLLAMLMAVSFLSLVDLTGNKPQKALPSGKSALLQSILGVHLFGAVINMSIVFIMADRFARAKRESIADSNNDSCCAGVTYPCGAEIQVDQMKVLSRGFCAAAFWSPFFAAVAVSLTYAPGAQLMHLIQAGIPMAILGLLITYFEIRPKANQFVGYPMQVSNLILPVILASAVVLCRWLLPDLSIIQVISILAPSITILVLLIHKAPLKQRLLEHSQNRLAKMGGELALFLSAGTMAAGLGVVFTLYADQLPIPELTPVVTSLLLLVMLLLSLLGVHPVISIASLSGLLLPTQPPIDLLAMLFLASWAIGTACSPMSGMNLSMRGRYFISAKQVLRSNLPYGAMMWVAASLSMWFYNPLN
ncbi:hypothetical protein SAMN02745127_00498 [Oceanospirillum multiglobuliferum]|uniref:Citrate transporter-like domain-containing protein n=1 Tax=Oceanospirillum multiglobuliferum TaxID=64969 RepID=A0A1T4LJI3_9GAMM|nr:hypothetical protein [Oceanospirillum multiglobuliferum]OPX56638.1 hypothetical protein BTE48_01685 [Oceanospirillum multiglobuliferum]SJZ54776.1 hypothetical protein SAMN02745127_00498 [Oceanospirillum multiglobuliferum]